MNVDQMFPSKYFRAVDLDHGDKHLVIDHVAMETLGEGEEAIEKPIIYFKNEEKGLVGNKTNMRTIAKALNSKESDEWSGRSITIYPTEVQFGAEMVPAIRVRIKGPQTFTSVKDKRQPAVKGRGRR